MINLNFEISKPELRNFKHVFNVLIITYNYYNILQSLIIYSELTINPQHMTPTSMLYSTESPVTGTGRSAPENASDSERAAFEHVCAETLTCDPIAEGAATPRI